MTATATATAASFDSGELLGHLEGLYVCLLFLATPLLGKLVRD